MISTILSILSAALMIYTLLCLADIIMSWIPGAKFTSLGKLISSICDPWMRIFSRIKWLQFGNLDFSPIVSIGILSLLSSILGGIQRTGRIYLGGILASVILMIWSVCSSLLGLLALLVFIRWIVLLVKHGQTEYGSAWENMDQFISKISYKVAGTFSKGVIDYQKSLLITWISFLIIIVLGRILTGLLAGLCGRLPF